MAHRISPWLAKMKSSHPLQSEAAEPGMTSPVTVFWNQDSSVCGIHCRRGEDPRCFQLADSLRPGLAPWISAYLARANETSNPKVSWQVTMRAQIDKGMADPALASILDLQFKIGKTSQKLVPTLESQGLVLCPETGCPAAELPGLPTATSPDSMDEAGQVLWIKHRTALIAPESGWLARLETDTDGTVIALDHPGFKRTLYRGRISLSAKSEIGGYLRKGQVLGYGGDPSEPLAITWLDRGMPTLPRSWCHGP